LVAQDFFSEIYSLLNIRLSLCYFNLITAVGDDEEP